MKRFISWSLALLLVSMLFAGSVSAFAAEESTKLYIVHTNDVHSRVEVEAYASQLVKNKRLADENVLLLSAGDVLHGQPIATLSRGKSIVEIMNAAGYDAMVPGNHDFNYGTERLFQLEDQMDFPLLAANIKDYTTGGHAFRPYTIKEFGDMKVGIFGIATPETKTKTNPGNVKFLNFTSPEFAARQTVGKLQSLGCDVIIAITHLGDDKMTIPEERSDAVAQVPGIDVIIDGHSHTILENGRMSGSTLIAQTGCHGEKIGMVELDITNKKVTKKTATLITYPIEGNPKALAPDPEVSALIAKINKANEKITSEIVGKTPVELNGEREVVRKAQTNLGDIITDAMLKETGAQIAFHNGGSIRATIKAGDITKGDVLTVLPFSNYIVVKQVTGDQLIKALEHSVSSYPELSGGFLHVGGFKFTFDPTAKVGSRVVSVTLNDGSAIERGKSYSLATNDYLVDGGDGFEMLNTSSSEIIYSALDEALIKYIQSNPVIKATDDGRVTDVSKKAA